MDFESLLMGVLNNRLTNLVANSSDTGEKESRGVPDSTRRAFESRMKADARVARMAAQNMEDGKSMVNVAQTNVTAIKSQLQSIQELLTNAAYSDSFSNINLADIKTAIGEHSAEIERLARNASFNGMNLFDGSLPNPDGSSGTNNNTVILQAGESQREQHFMILLDGFGIVDSGGSMDLSKATLDSDLAQFTTQADAKAALERIDKYIDRIRGLEAQYSYDYRSLDNLSLLFEEQADIYDDTWERSASTKGTSTSTNNASILSELLSSSSSSILNGVS
ncbi:MAG: hypothetical protein IJU76_00550 [Desulfovibrionaceae bacterium]|nr:hypothetical protein [Desulfovibrionaceae bacterium]